MSKAQKLVLLTSEFPYGSGETFLETEITYLAKGFEEVIILVTQGKGLQTRVLPENCKAEILESQLSGIEKVGALRFLFNRMFWQEFKVIKSTYKINVSFGIFNTMLISLARGYFFKKILLKRFGHAANSSSYAYYSYWCEDTALGLALLRRENGAINAISRIHGWDVYFETSSIGYLPYRHLIAHNLSKIVSISEKGKVYCKEVWRLENLEKLCVSRLGVREQNRPEFVPKKHELLLVSCSSLIPLKRVDLIIEALALLVDSPINWVHFGDGPMQEELIEKSNKLLPENIQWEFKGRVSNQEVLNWYKDHQPDLFINVSSSEGVPVSIMEAMSFGIPAMATDVGGNAEIVNGENGYLLPKELTPRDISKKMMEYLLLTREDNDSKRKNAYQTWKTKYHAEVNYQQFVQEIKSLGVES
jgi:colanic acid/amylovoran biosynthesis glycosyltransferase